MQMLKPFNFPGHSTGADLTFAKITKKKQAGRWQRGLYKAQQGWLIGQSYFPFPKSQTQMM